MPETLLAATDRGLYCAAGDFYIDPWRPVDRAIITHGHSDHARWGSKNYLCATDSVPLLRERLGADAHIESVPFRQTFTRNDVTVSLHPAGHIPGSAQVRVERAGEVWVFTGDYKTEPDGFSEPFELVRCNTFISECTFGLPIFRWHPQAEVFADMNEWWHRNQELERTSVIFGYSLGKAQRILHGLDPSLGPIFVHGAVERFVHAYRKIGIELPPVERATAKAVRAAKGKAMVVAPPSTDNSTWLRGFGETSLAFASGWMAIRGTRRRRALDRGFVLSDHVDWPALLETIKETGATRIWMTHGYTEVMARWLREKGYDAEALRTAYKGEIVEEEAAAENQPATESSPGEKGREANGPE